VPSGFKINPDTNTFRAVVCPQRESTFIGFTFNADDKTQAPRWLIDLLVYTMLPEMVRRLVANVNNCLKPDGPYGSMIAEDKYGMYDEAARLVQGSQQKANSQDVAYSPKSPPKAEDVLHRSRNIYEHRGTSTAVSSKHLGELRTIVSL
jgi:hypothetical protein